MLRLNPVSFTMNDNPGQTEYGFIAQDVQQILPELVVTSQRPIKDPRPQLSRLHRADGEGDAGVEG